MKAVFPLVALALLGCDFPTQIPRYDTHWDVVVARDSIATSDLLPDGMRVTPEGFVLDSFAAVAEVRIGDVCELCTCFQGPIPSLEIAAHDWPVRLPGGLLEATLDRGSAHVEITNRVGFDLLDNGEGGKGFLSVDLTDIRDQSVVGQAYLVEPFPPEQTRTLSFDLGGLELSRYLVARVKGSTPGSGCHDVPLTPESGFRTEVELRDVLASSVRVWVGDRALRLPERQLALPAFLADRLRSGDATLDIEVLVETTLPAGVEIGVSVAGRPEDLFTSRAALYTPILIPAGTPAGPGTVRRLYVVQLDRVHGAERLHVATRNRFLDEHVLELGGGEAVSYQVRVRAQVPSR